MTEPASIALCHALGDFMLWWVLTPKRKIASDEKRFVAFGVLLLAAIGFGFFCHGVSLLWGVK